MVSWLYVGLSWLLGSLYQHAAVRLAAIFVAAVVAANYPHQAIKGGYFVFLWIVGTRLDLILDES